MALTKKDHELIAQIAAQAAVAAVAAMGAQAPAAAPEEPEVDDVAEDRAARASIEENERKAAQIAAMAEDLIPELMQERHLIVFKWAAQQSGLTVGGLLRQVVRTFVASKTNDWREAQGAGGSSSRNLEGLTERLPARK